MSRHRRGSGGPRDAESGSAAAELAVAMPAVIVVIALGVGALSAAGQQVRLQDAAADAARLAARGESSARVHAAVASAVPGAGAAIAPRGDIVCVTAAWRFTMGIDIPLRAEACALAGGL